MSLSRSAHIDTFARRNLPAEDAWPVLEFTLPELNYPDRLNAAEVLLDGTIARFGGDRIAFITPGDGAVETERWTYDELRVHVDRFAYVLRDDYHLQPGNRVLLRQPNNAWAAATWLAVLKVGAIAVTTMVAWRTEELRKVIEKTAPSLAIADARYVDDLYETVGSTFPIALLGGEDDLIARSALKQDSFKAVQTAADDVAIFGPTSGTTGIPKITVHFHRDILAIADTFPVSTLALGPDDVSAGSPPLAFTFGLGGLVIFPLRHGGSAVLLERPSPVALAEAIETFGITVLYTAPTGYRTILREGRAGALAKLRVAVSAGEHLSKETFDTVEEAAGVRLVNGIGATEMLHVFISAAGEDIRPGATGKAIPGFRATILDAEGNELPADVAGRLAVIGPTGCRYLADERQGVYVLNGWNVTGDTYVRDKDGYFFYQARTDDIIVASGYNIGAPEVEAVIDSHPAVVESAVVGRPDLEKGTIVNAFVVVKEGVVVDDVLRAEIQGAVRARLAPYKIPRRIDFIESLPRNASGKLQRFPLRQRAEAEEAAVTN
jgi:2-aminobenzoate-CoA ligase